MYQSTGLTTHEFLSQPARNFFAHGQGKGRGRLLKLLVPRGPFLFGLMTPLANRTLPPFWRERVPFEGQRLLKPVATLSLKSLPILG